jgi:sugar lactone lactonase YvrE
MTAPSCEEVDMPRTWWPLASILLVFLFLWACGGSDNQGSNGLVGGNIQGRPLALSNDVTTWAGDNTGTIPVPTDCTVTGLGASFSYPCGVTTDGTFLYVADTDNHLIRKILIATGAVTTIAGDGTGTPGATDCTMGTGASFSSPRGITTDGASLYVADTDNHRIRRIAIGGTWTVETIAGDGNPTFNDCTVTGLGASFQYPRGITTDGSFLYVADTDNHRIRKVTIGGAWAVTTVAGDSTGTVPPATDCTVTGLGASFQFPEGIATDGSFLYVADKDNHLIRRIAIGGTWAVTTIAGDSTGTVPPATDCTVTGLGASFQYPRGIATDGTFLYVADTENNLIRKIGIGTPWAVTTIAGDATTPGMQDGTGGSATFDYPRSVATDGSSLFVADSQNNLIRKIH